MWVIYRYTAETRHNIGNRVFKKTNKKQSNNNRKGTRQKPKRRNSPVTKCLATVVSPGFKPQGHTKGLYYYAFSHEFKEWT